MKILGWLYFLGAILVGDAFAAPPKRIISLAPNMTEILYALGLEEKIVGVTSYCDIPPSAKGKPKVGGMSNPSLEAVATLRPDLVILTTDGNRREFEDRLRRLHIATYVFRARQLAELPSGIRDLGPVLGVTAAAENLASRIEETVSRIRAAAQRQAPEKTALFIVWPEPAIVAGPGTAIDDALELLGWHNVAGDVENEYPKYSVEEILRRAPHVIFIGKGHPNMREISAGLLKKLEGLEVLRAGRVYFTGDALYRLGPRVVEGIEELARFLKHN
ncbi:MAG: cobalamin-binding protein [bacterium]|nr:cobalamin-binding protein [bacterium]